MENKFKIFDTIAEWQSAELGSNVVSLIREDNSIRYSGGFATYPDYSTVAKILRINNVDVLPDTSGTIDLGKVITEHQDISHLASKSELSTKQDVIEDLVEIRDNADLAENSVQHIIANDITYNPLNGEIDLGKVVTSVKTINGESIEGSGNIEIGGSNIVIFNPEGDPAEEHAKLVNAYNNGLPIYFGGIVKDVLKPELPAIIMYDDGSQTFTVYVFNNLAYGASAMLIGMSFTVDINSISTIDNVQLALSTSGDGTKFLSDNGQYKTPVYIFEYNSAANISTLRNDLENVLNNNIPCLVKISSSGGQYTKESYIPCEVMRDEHANPVNYLIYAFYAQSNGETTSYVTFKYTITSTEVTIDVPVAFDTDSYALKSETGVAYAEYTGTSTAAEVTTKYGYFPTTLVEGARVSVKFEGNLTYIKTLNVNGTGANNVYYNGSSLTSGMINRYNTYDFIFDGNYWRIIGVNTDTDTHHTAKNIVGATATATANAAATNGNVYLNLIENSTVRSKHNIKGEGTVTVTSDASGNIIISGSSSDANVKAVDTTETVDDVNEVPNVKYVAQTLTDAQKTQARTNIGAASSVMVEDMNDLLESVNTDLADLTSNKQNVLVSGTNIKTVNSTTLLGSGNLSVGTITGVSANGTSVATSGVANIPAASTSKYGVTKLSSSTSSTSTSLAATASAVKAAYDLANGKQAALVSGTNIKTINGQSLLGSGNITIEGGSGNSSNSEQGIVIPADEPVLIIRPGVYNIVNLETLGCDIELGNIPSSSEIASGIVREWKLIIRYLIVSPISFLDSILWANDNAPEFEVGDTYEFSFIASLDAGDLVKILGVWSKFDTGNPSSSGTNPA